MRKTNAYIASRGAPSTVFALSRAASASRGLFLANNDLHIRMIITIVSFNEAGRTVRKGGKKGRKDARWRPRSGPQAYPSAYGHRERACFGRNAPDGPRNLRAPSVGSPHDVVCDCLQHARGALFGGPLRGDVALAGVGSVRPQHDAPSSRRLRRMRRGARSSVGRRPFRRRARVVGGASGGAGRARFRRPFGRANLSRRLRGVQPRPHQVQIELRRKSAGPAA